MNTSLAVAGVTPFTTIDYPERLSAVVFCRGCPWRCPYCHNAHLRAFGAGGVEWAEVLAFLKRRRGLLDAVVFSGGEPTAQAALAPAMREARALGYAVGLHTGGAYPERLRAVLAYCDWVGFDVKAPFGPRYDFLTGVAGAGENARASLAALVASGIPFQVRTTVDPAILSAEDLELIDAQMARAGAPKTVRQTMRPVNPAAAPFAVATFP